MGQFQIAVDRPAFYAYSTNYLVDVDAGIIVDVEATPALRTDEVSATRTMIDRVQERFNLKANRLIGDMAYGAAELLGWMVDEKQIEPHVPVWDKPDQQSNLNGRTELVLSRFLHHALGHDPEIEFTMHVGSFPNELGDPTTSY